MAYYKMGLLFPLNLHHLYLTSTHFRSAVQVHPMNLVINPIFRSQVLGLARCCCCCKSLGSLCTDDPLLYCWTLKV